MTKTEIKLFISCILFMITTILMFTRYNTEQQKLVCYETLYNEDIIGVGCDEHFKNDAWYIEYMRDGKHE